MFNAKTNKQTDRQTNKHVPIAKPQLFTFRCQWNPRFSKCPIFHGTWTFKLMLSFQEQFSGVALVLTLFNASLYHLPKLPGFWGKPTYESNVTSVGRWGGPVMDPADPARRCTLTRQSPRNTVEWAYNLCYICIYIVIGVWVYLYNFKYNIL